MPAQFFVSYRRTLDPGFVGRVNDRLAAHFGESDVFMDADSIGAGREYRLVIERALAAAHVLLAVIGERWSEVEDATGHRRLDDPDDYVVWEIRTALARGIPVVPVLLGDADLPARGELPEPLRPLLDRQAIRVRHESFRSDVTTLISELDALVAEPEPEPEPGRDVDRGSLPATGTPATTGPEVPGPGVPVDEPAPALRLRGPLTAPAPRWVAPAAPGGRTGDRAPASTGFQLVAPTVPARPLRDPGAPSVVGDESVDASGLTADSGANPVVRTLLRVTLRLLPGTTPTVILWVVAAVGPVYLLFSLWMVGIYAEATTDRATGSPFVVDPMAGLGAGLLGSPIVVAIVGFVAFWIVLGFRKLMAGREPLDDSDFGVALFLAVAIGMAPIVFYVGFAAAGLAWIVDHQQVSRTDGYSWVGLVVVAGLIVLCWLSVVSVLILERRPATTSRSFAERWFPVLVGVLAVLAAAATATVDARVEFAPGWRWGTYIGSWAVLAFAATALVVESMGQDFWSWRLTVGAVAVALAVVGSVVGFVLMA